MDGFVSLIAVFLVVTGRMGVKFDGATVAGENAFYVVFLVKRNFSLYVTPFENIFQDFLGRQRGGGGGEQIPLQQTFLSSH